MNAEKKKDQGKAAYKTEEEKHAKSRCTGRRSIEPVIQIRESYKTRNAPLRRDRIGIPLVPQAQKKRQRIKSFPT